MALRLFSCRLKLKDDFFPNFFSFPTAVKCLSGPQNSSPVMGTALYSLASKQGARESNLGCKEEEMRGKKQDRLFSVTCGTVLPIPLLRHFLEDNDLEHDPNV